MGKKLHDIGLGNDYMNRTPKTQATEAKVDKRDYIKLKSKGNNQKMKRQLME